MHVILEGILPLETRLMLAGFIEDNFLNLEMLNDRIQNFSYGLTEARNKPPKPFDKAHLMGPKPKLRLSGLFSRICDASCMYMHFFLLYYTASQMWNLAVLLPLIIGDKIPVNDKRWESYLLLVEITKICTARVTSTALSDYLAVLIEEHHQVFRSCYPAISMTPKTHYMVHFPRLLKQ